MKKVLLLFVSLLAVVGLSGCDLFNNGELDDILTNEIVDNWDGSLEHVEVVLEAMDLENAMTQTATFNAVINDGYSTFNVSTTTVDKMVFGEYDMMHREMTQTMNIDGELVETSTEMLYVEVETGVQVYMNVAPIKQLLQEQGAGEVVEGMEALGMTGSWMQFNFDDSLANVIEIEVLKEMLREALYKELGTTYFYDLQDELETEIDFDLSPYGVDFGLFVDHILNERFTEAEALLDAIDTVNLFDDLDSQVLTPMAKDALDENSAEILAALPTYDIEAAKTFIQTNGVVEWHEQLTEEEYDVMWDVFLEEGYFVPIHLELGDLPNFIMVQLLTDPYNTSDLEEIPGLDVALLQTNVELIDFDLLKDEVVDYALLFEAIYNGSTEFQAFLDSIETTAPNHVLILEPWVETAGALDDVRMVIEDIETGLTNLDMFSEYFTLEYYVNSNMATADIQLSTEGDIVTSVQFENYGYLFDDLFTDLYWYLDDFSSFEMPYVNPINCPAGEYCEMVPMDDVVNQLNQFGPINATISYDAVAQDAVEIHVDLAPLLNEFMMEVGATEEMAETLEFSLTIEDQASITMPSTATNMNDVLMDFAKFSLFFQVWDILDEMQYDLMMDSTLFSNVSGQTVTLISLEDEWDLYYDVSGAFDLEMSTVTVGTAYDDLALQLYWVDGTAVFTEPITYNGLIPVIGNGSGAPDATEYQTYLAKVDPTTFNMTKLFLSYMMEDMNGGIEFWDPERDMVYADALAIENATKLYCAQTQCDDYEEFTWAQISPYVEGIDLDYYELESTTVVSEVYYGSYYVMMEAAGEGNYEFPDWIQPSYGSPEDVYEDWD